MPDKYHLAITKELEKNGVPSLPNYQCQRPVGGCIYLVIGLLILFLFGAMAPRIIFIQSLGSTPILTSTLSAQFIQGSSLDSSPFFVMIEANLSPGSPPPNPGHLKANLAVEFNYQTVAVQTCNLNFKPKSTYAQCSISIPTHGYGGYTFSATITNQDGNLIAQSNTVMIQIGGQSGITTITTTTAVTSTSATLTSAVHSNPSLSSNSTTPASEITRIDSSNVTTTTTSPSDGQLRISPSQLQGLATIGFLVLMTGVALLFLARRNH